MPHVRRWTLSHPGLVAVGLAGAATLGFPALGSAQRFLIAPTLGVYVSAGQLYSSGSIDNPATYVAKRPEGSPIVGFTAIYWASDHIGVRGAVAFGPAATAVTDSNGTYDDPSGAWFASAEVIATLHPFRSVNSVYIGAGGGMVSWKGSEWQYASGTTVPAFVGTIGITFPIRPLWAAKPYKPARSVWFFEVNDYLSNSPIDKGMPDQQPAAWRGDLNINLGLAITLGNW
jgi:hypothetical protein